MSMLTIPNSIIDGRNHFRGSHRPSGGEIFLNDELPGQGAAGLRVGREPQDAFHTNRRVEPYLSTSVRVDLPEKEVVRLTFARDDEEDTVARRSTATSENSKRNR